MKKIPLFIFLALSGALSAYGEVPGLLTYQGRLKESGQAVTGNREISIFLCDAEFGGNCHSNGAQPVAVSNGLFRSTFTIPSAVNFGTGNWWLSIFVGATELSPRERLTSNAYALFSATAAYAENISAASGAEAVLISSNVYIVGYSSAAVYYGDGSQLTGVTAAGAVLKTGDTMNGHLIIAYSSLTVIGDTLLTNYSLAAGTGTTPSHIYVSTTGNVGVGTSAPQSRLDVVSGSITVRGSNAALVLSDSSRSLYPEADPALGGGIRFSTNVYIVGFSSASFYYGDGSGLTNVQAVETDAIVGAVSGIVKANGAGAISAASAGTDYLAPAGDGSALSGVITSTAVIVTALAGKVGLTGDESVAGAKTFTGTVDANNLCIAGNCKSSWPFSPGSEVLQMGSYAVNTSSHITAAAYQINGSTVLAFKPASFSFMAGQDAGRLTTGNHGTFVGTNAGYNNTTGQENTFVGSNSGQANSVGEANTALGYFAGYNMTGTNNTMVGRGSGFYASTSWDNTFIGKNAGLYNPAGSANVVVGSDAGYGDFDGSFSSSTLLGYGAGYNMLTGVGNVLIGYKAGYNIDTGTGNIIIGFEKDAPAPGTNSHLNIGGAIFGDLITGNIGVGTASPRSRLDVWGSGSLYLGQTGFAHGIIKSDDSMTLNIDANNDANNTFLEVTSGVGTPLLHVVQPGLAGVGNSNPMAALDVKSTGTLVSQYAQIWRNSGGTEIASMTATGTFNVGGNLRVNAAGSGLQIAEGADARMGTVNLTAGTATVSNTSVTANTRIFLTVQSLGGNLGIHYVSARVPGTSFTITSSDIGDTSTIAWLLIEP